MAEIGDSDGTLPETVKLKGSILLPTTNGSDLHTGTMIKCKFSVLDGYTGLLGCDSADLFPRLSDTFDAIPDDPPKLLRGIPDDPSFQASANPTPPHLPLCTPDDLCVTILHCLISNAAGAIVLFCRVI